MGKAAGYSDVNLNTAQLWISNGLVTVARGGAGTGDKRYLDIMGVMEIGVVKELRDQHNLDFKDISQVMEDLRQGCPLTLARALAYEDPILLVRSYSEHREGGRILRGHCIVADEDKVYQLWGSREGEDLGDRIAWETRTFKEFWVECTLPESSSYIGVCISYLAFVRDRVLSRIG